MATGALTPRQLSALRSRVLSLYFSIVIVGFVAIAVLLLYVLQLGSLVGPGTEESLGLAISLMFLVGALLVHVMDRTYREWPLGRRVHPAAPPPVTDLSVALALQVAVIVAAVLLCAYIIAGLVS
jgi:hypothetical protein